MKKNPTSTNGYQCIGPCYKAGTYVIHPYNMEMRIDKQYNMCPIEPFKEHDYNKYFDQCDVPTHDADVKLFEMNIVTPRINFSTTQFLKIYYGIYTYVDALAAINDTSKPLLSRLRILECLFKSFYNEIDYVDDDLINFIILVINELWIESIYHYVRKYITIDDDQVHFSKYSTNTMHSKDIYVSYKDMTKKYIINKFINKNVINNIIIQFLKDNRKNWDYIDSHNNLLMKTIGEYIETKILEIIE